MSFTRFLAASRTIMGLRKKPGPYRMNEEHLLPRFEPVRKLNGANAESAVEVSPEVTDSGDAGGRTEGERNPKVEGKARDGQPKGRARLLTRMAGRVKRLVRRPGRGGQAQGEKRAVQAELSLDTVKVVRNDLSDSDYQVSANGGKNRLEFGKTLGEPLGMVWNRLSARLLRQAAQEFHLVQKERGKLLSQAGNGAAGPHGS